jgi:hypothetical protein
MGHAPSPAAQVFELAGLMKDRRFRALVLLAMFASLRWGEVIALRRVDDLAASRRPQTCWPSNDPAGRSRPIT